MNPRLWLFSGGDQGQFSVLSIRSICGQELPQVERLHVTQSSTPPGAIFCLRGVVSNERYTSRIEKNTLLDRQEAIDRKEAHLGTLIPIKKSADWWALTQDERRAVFEERSSHIRIGLEALPQVARRLHHCRDLEEDAPFDFLTWFDFREEDAQVFHDLLGALRATEEWKYVEREVEIWVAKESG